jgi:hypothetical protein
MTWIESKMIFVFCLWKGVESLIFYGFLLIMNLLKGNRMLHLLKYVSNQYLFICFRYLNVKQAEIDKLSEKYRKWPKNHWDIELNVINLVSLESFFNFSSVGGCKNLFPKMVLKKPDHNLVGLVGAELFFLCSLNNCTKLADWY